MSDDRSVEEIREQKFEELQAGQEQDSPSEPVHIDGQSGLRDVTVTYNVVLVDFYADWCGPCQMIEPIVEEIAVETDATVAKVDIDAHQGLASEYGVRGVPTLLLFVDSEPVERVVGMQGKESLRNLIDQHTNP